MLKYVFSRRTSCAHSALNPPFPHSLCLCAFHSAAPPPRAPSTTQAQGICVCLSASAFALLLAVALLLLCWRRCCLDRYFYVRAHKYMHINCCRGKGSSSTAQAPTFCSCHIQVGKKKQNRVACNMEWTWTWMVFLSAYPLFLSLFLSLSLSHPLFTHIPLYSGLSIEERHFSFLPLFLFPAFRRPLCLFSSLFRLHFRCNAATLQLCFSSVCCCC